MKNENNKTTKTGLKDGFTRHTFTIREKFLEDLQCLSFFKKKPMKELVDEALTKYLKGKKIPKLR